MSILIKERLSDSPYIERIWRSQTSEAGTFTSIASSHTELVIWEEAGKTNISLRGPETIASIAPVPENSPAFGIIFKLGVTLHHIPIEMLVDKHIILPRAGSQSFWLKGAVWQFPNYENVDSFVNRLVQEDLLGHDPLVESTLSGNLPNTSIRTLQRRFLQATGITHTAIHQIERARYATMLLKNGVSILDTMSEAGYYDQPHLTRLLKRYIGQTPAQIADKNNTDELSFLYKTDLMG